MADLINLRMLDKDFNLINTLEYINLQWIRRYYSPGEFQVLVPASEYHSEAAYIYTPDRRETGIIQKPEYEDSAEGEFRLISGFFMEKWLDDKIIYPTMNYSGNIELGARSIVSTYKEDIPVVLGAVKGLGSSIIFQNRGTELGEKIYTLLEEQELSYSIDHDYINSANIFNVWQGADRTQDQSDNNRIAFSKSLGNVTGIHKMRDNSAFKNYAVIAGEGEGAERVIVEYDASGGAYKQKLWVDARDLSQEELTAQQYRDVLIQRGIEKLKEHEIIEEIDLEIDPYKKGRRYLVDFDLGDKCDVGIEAPDGVEHLTVRVVEITEVIKENNWTINITLGNKSPTLLQKATR